MPEPILLTVKESTEILRISKTTFLRLVAGTVKGQPALPTLRIGRRILVHRDTLNNFIRSQKVNSPA